MEGKVLLKRWAELRPWNPLSPLQVKAYIKKMGYPMPKHRTNRDEQGERKETMPARKAARRPTPAAGSVEARISTAPDTIGSGWPPGRDPGGDRAESPPAPDARKQYS